LPVGPVISAPAAAMSRMKARDTGTPNNAAFSAGATSCSQRSLPYFACTAARPRANIGRPIPPPGFAAAGKKTIDSTGRGVGGGVFTSNWSSVASRPSRSKQAPPPPRLARDGRVTVSAKASATPASAALPPCARISRAIAAARGSSATA
jgi:hypothetical protein